MDASNLLGLLADTLARLDADMPLASRLCRACVEIFGAQSGALTLSPSPEERLVVSTSDGMSARIEDLQEVLGEGPGQLALEQDRLVVTRVDGTTAGTFPMFSQMVRSIGGPVTAYAVPMRVRGLVVGVLSLYTTDGRLSHDLVDVQFLADAVGTSLLDDVEPLDWSVQARAHQAAGMVTAQLRIPPADALAVLRAHAFARSSTLQDVVDDVLAHRLDFAHDDASDDETERTEEP
ncbi:GAF and ANTAR domain-containing protein [Isoptericola sp. F-RaC21]|uniref:GAF and ANTAR domain-containing protein n=1 Tax=Isoptericola sp. F-RaC21 TaxID=3141452 RepID=UPI00315B9ECF